MKLIQIPRLLTRATGVVIPLAREMAEMQWYAPFHMDATETARTFGLTATDLKVPILDQVSDIAT